VCKRAEELSQLPTSEKCILVGITYPDLAGRELRQQQLHWIIESAARDGIRIALKGVRDGESWNMPPDLQSIRPASAGRCTLRTTGETISDPDLLAT
jgi:hypothetical protein